MFFRKSLDKLFIKRKSDSVSEIPFSKPRMIKCPYCFEEFSHENVHFKAISIMSPDIGGFDIGDNEFKKDRKSLDNFEGKETESSEDDFGITEDEMDPFGSSEGTSENLSEREYARLFEEKQDPLFKKFWDSYSNELSWEYANYPVITGKDPRMMKGSYQRDGDDMVVAVTDHYGKKTTERICPFCHNPLPANYGKYPVHFIATVGITDSGKTVYLSQLLKGMDEYMGNVKMASVEMSSAVSDFLQKHPVKKDVPLPKGTLPGLLNPPLFYAILTEGAGYTLVFYDVAGEDCTDEKEMNRYGAFIKNADGVIMILDPEQFMQISRSDDKNVRPKTVLEAMYKAFLGQGKTGVKSEIPLALALSKSDRLEKTNLFPSNSNIFKDIDYSKGNFGFDLVQYRNLAGEVRRFLDGNSQGKAVLNVADRFFSRTGFFAFSALNCDVIEEKKIINGQSIPVSKPAAHPIPRRIEEPLYWMLSEFGILQKIEPQPR